MKTPYEILEVTEEADDALIKKAYLAGVRRYPPERFPDDFQRIYRAYELIKTDQDRLSYRLFHCELPAPAEIAALILGPRAKSKLPAQGDFHKELGDGLKMFCKDLIL